MFLLFIPVTSCSDTPVIYSCYWWYKNSCYRLMLSARYMFIHTHYCSIHVTCTCMRNHKDLSDHVHTYSTIIQSLWDGETWYLIKSYWVGVWIHYCPTIGDEVVLATVCYSPMSSRFSFPVTCFALVGWPWSQQPVVYLRPWPRVCTGYTHLIRTSLLFSLTTRVYTFTNSIVHIYFSGLIVIIDISWISCLFHVSTYVKLFYCFHTFPLYTCSVASENLSLHAQI